MVLKVSSAIIDLTPEQPASLGGFAHGRRTSSRVHSRLEANVVVFAAGDERVILVAIDLLFVGRDLRLAIESAARQAFGVEPSRVITLASHTHFAPMLDRLKPGLGEISEGELDRWRDRLAAAFGQLSSAVQCDRVCRGLGQSFAAANRRKPWPWPTLIRVLGRKRGGIYMADNSDGPVDRSIRVWVWSGGGKPAAVLWAFACHPTGLPDSTAVSAEFPGVVRQALRDHFGSGVPVLYAPTCMGDVRPRTGLRSGGLRGLIALARYGPRVRGFRAAEWDAWSRALADEVVGALSGVADEPLGDATIASAEVSVPIDRLVDGHCPTDDLVCKTIRLPGLGRIVTLSCEPVTEVGPLIGKGADLVVGYEGDVFGYVPVDHMLKEGGYEAGGYFPAFGMTGKLKPGIDSLLRETGDRLIEGLASADAISRQGSAEPGRSRRGGRTERPNS